MRRAWLFFASSMLVGTSTMTACGDAFTSAPGDDGGPSGSDAADDGDGMTDPETSVLEGGPGADSGVDAHHDGATDSSHADTSMQPDTSTMPDTSTVPDTSTTPDTGPVLDACTAVVASETTGVFVSLSGAASGCGSKAVPCSSIQTALNLAQTLNLHFVYVDNGTYYESLSLVPNVTILGGWVGLGGNWTRQCGVGNAASVTVKAPANASTTITANNVANAAIDTLTVQSKDAGSVGAGESIYGIFASGSTTLSLTNVAVSVVGGGNGSVGGTGGAGTNASGTCSPSSNGGKGTPGNGGASGQAGTFSASGYAPAVGGTGGAGGVGNNGTLSAPGCAASGTCDETPDSQCAGTITYGAQVCGTAGAAGCGGGGAGGGAGGSGGGSSFALYVWGATVTLDGGALASGNGGTGGAGGSPGTAGQGSAGTTGMATKAAPNTCTTKTYNPGVNQTYGCIPSNFTLAAGGVGGMGGAGGDGGSGGGGAGGSSYSYFFGGGGSVTPNGTSLTFGNAGSGGSGGNAGAPGAAAQHN